MTDLELSTRTRDAHLVTLYLDGVPVRLIAEQVGMSRSMVHSGLCRALGLPNNATMTMVDDCLYQEALKARLAKLRHDEGYGAAELEIKLIAMLARLQGLGTINLNIPSPNGEAAQTSTDRIRAAINRIRAPSLAPPLQPDEPPSQPN